MEAELMSQIDAERSRLLAEKRIAERRYMALRAPARRLAAYFIEKSTENLLDMHCRYCESEWVRDEDPQHDPDCPVGLVNAALAALKED